jgi:hypothetical protein
MPNWSNFSAQLYTIIQTNDNQVKLWRFFSRVRDAANSKRQYLLQRARHPHVNAV